MAYPTQIDARQFVRELSLHATALDYDDTMVDLAIQGAAYAYFEKMGPTFGSGTVAVASGVPTLDFSGIVGFTPTKLNTMFIDDYPVLVRTETGLRDLTRNNPMTGRPSHIAFTSETAALCWGTPDANYTINLAFDPAFTSWTVGAAGAVTLNIPREHLMNVCTLGATVILQSGDPRTAYGTRQWQQFLNWIDSRIVRRDTKRILVRDQSRSRW